MVENVITAVLLLPAVGCAVRSRGRVRGTTLAAAQRWAVAALFLASTSCLLSLGGGDGPRGRNEGMWYLTSVTALCPWIAVLGARRPGVGAWTWFVLWPLVAVLGWPVLSVGWSTAATLEVPTPLLLGYVLVLLMGVGNYIGTRYTLPAAVAGLGHCLLAAPLADTAPDWLTAAEWAWTGGAAALAAAVLWADRVSRLAAGVPPGLDRLWFDFRDTFGMVWGRRFLERVNQRAEAEGWMWRLTETGMTAVNSAATPEAPERDPRIEHTFRRLLRRYVDPEWIARRLGAQPANAG